MRYEKFEIPVLVTPNLIQEVTPRNGKVFSLEELQTMLEGPVQLITLPSGVQLWVNENGKTDELQKNGIATLLWRIIWADKDIGADDYICGSALFTLPKYTEEETDLIN